MIFLISAALVSLLLEEYFDSIAIIFIVVLNAVGVIQELKPEQALAAPKKRRCDRDVITRRRRVSSFRVFSPADNLGVASETFAWMVAVVTRDGPR